MQKNQTYLRKEDMIVSKKAKLRAKKAAYIASAIILTLLLAITIAMGIFADTINSLLFSSSALGAEAREKGEKLATQIVEEGTVMVKNDNDVLPLSLDIDCVNVFGWRSTEWINGGSGSGRVVNEGKSSPTYSSMIPSRDFLAALTEYGVNYNTELTNMYSNFQKEHEYWGKGTLNTTSENFYRLYEPSIANRTYYTQAMLNNAKEYSDTAIVVLGRTAGESCDPTAVQYKITTKGGNVETDKSRTYLDISTEEEELLKYVGANYENVVVVINSTNTMNLGFMNTIEGLDSCLICGGTGDKAADGLVNVLYGDVSPSGRLVDTYAYDFSTSPAYTSSGEVGTMRYTNSDGKKVSHPFGTKEVNGKTQYADGISYIDYVEGIYVGYKWYETAYEEGFWKSNAAKRQWGYSDVSRENDYGYNSVVQYPFGYGLSYTTFDWEITNAPTGKLDEKTTLEFSVKVTNTGNVAGKEVVELYYSVPYTDDGIEKSAISLGAYAKTSELMPRESETVTLKIDVRDMASYDSQEIKVQNGGYILEAGKYEFKFMTDCHNLKDMPRNTYSFNLTEDKLYPTDETTGETVSNKFTGENAIDGISIDGRDTQLDAEGNPAITYLKRSDIAGTFKFKAEATNTKKGRLFSSNMPATLRYATGDAATAWDQAHTDVAMPTQNSGSGNLLFKNGQLTELGLTLGNPDNYDSELWDDVLNQISIDEMKELTLHGYVQEKAVDSVGKKQTFSVDGPNQVGSFNQQNAGTGYPNSTVLAQTWNVKLAQDFGASMAADALGTSRSGVYAPGMNIHRTPFGGRNYEYYSEDTYMTGTMAAAVVNGYLDGGVYVYAKHFGLYEQETTRDGIYTWITEQTFRETYLKAFKMAIDDGGLTGLMSCYGRIGSTWQGGSEGLLTGVLRNEWGFNGTVITDYADNHNYMNGDEMIRAGGDLWMDGVGDGGKYKYQTSSAAIVNQLRNATKHILYTQVNAGYRLVNQSGGDLSATLKTDVFPWWIPILVVVDVLAVAGCGVWIFFTIRYNRRLKKGLIGNDNAPTDDNGNDGGKPNEKDETANPDNDAVATDNTATSEWGDAKTEQTENKTTDEVVEQPATSEEVKSETTEETTATEEPKTEETAVEEKVDEPKAEEPEEVATADEPKAEKAGTIAEEKTEEPKAETVTETKAEEPATETKAEEAPAKKPTTRKTTATRSTTAKSTATKSTGTKSTASKSTGTKSTTAKSTASKSTTAKTTATKTSTAKSSTAKKTTTTKSAATKKSDDKAE